MQVTRYKANGTVVVQEITMADMEVEYTNPNGLGSREIRKAKQMFAAVSQISMGRAMGQIAPEEINVKI